MSPCRYYVYKCVVDDGGAPCVDGNLLSLTICKPYIRSTARKGDLIFAFGSNDENPMNRLVYIAIVGERISNGKYFERLEYRNRQDCIYEWIEGGRLRRRGDAKFHDYPEARISDLGNEPHYPKANALVAQDFRYFGASGNDDWKAGAERVRTLVEGLGQGHRVNFSPELLRELIDLKSRTWRDNPTERILGKPLHAPDERMESDSEELVKVCKHRCYYIPRKRC